MARDGFGAFTASLPSAVRRPFLALFDRIKAIEALLNVQHGIATLALDAGGRGTITYPRSFSTSPTFVATARLNSTGTVTVHVISATTTAAVVQVDRDGTPEASVTRDVHWIAWAP